MYSTAMNNFTAYEYVSFNVRLTAASKREHYNLVPGEKKIEITCNNLYYN